MPEPVGVVVLRLADDDRKIVRLKADKLSGQAAVLIARTEPSANSAWNVPRPPGAVAPGQPLPVPTQGPPAGVAALPAARLVSPPYFL